jgi:molybdate transport system substrate-binding protein
VAGASILQLPKNLEVGAAYGLIVLGSRPASQQLADFIVSAGGQEVLAKHGFKSVAQ